MTTSVKITFEENKSIEATGDSPDEVIDLVNRAISKFFTGSNIENEKVLF